MFRNSALLSASKTSAFEHYKNEILTTNQNVYHQLLSLPQFENNKNGQIIRRKKSKSKSGGVSFNMNTNVISYEGGKENFFDDDDNESLNEFVESLNELSTKSEIKLEMNSDFDQLTATNTEYNSNRVNFQETHKLLVNNKSDPENHQIHQPPDYSPLLKKSAEDDAQRINNSTVPTYVSIFKYPLVPANIEENSKPKILAVKGVNGHESLVTDRVDNIEITNGHHCKKVYSEKTKIKHHSEQSPSPGKEIEKPSVVPSEMESSSYNIPSVPVRKSRSRDNNSMDPRMYTGKKTGKVNKTVDERLKILAVDLESQRKSPKRPAPPPPKTLHQSRAEMSNSGKTVHPRSTSLNLSIRNNVENGQRLDLCHSTPRRTVPATKPVPNEPTPNCPSSESSDMINGRGRFASIRKFLRIEQKTMPDKKFRSLRRFPSPFTRSRIDLAEMRSLFHTENGKCNAANEIATDSDVVVTEITEIHSAANTLNRSKTEGMFPIYIIVVSEIEDVSKNDLHFLFAGLDLFVLVMYSVYCVCPYLLHSTNLLTM